MRGHATYSLPRMHCLPARFWILPSTLALLVVGCGVVYSLRPEKAVEDALKTLSAPEGATELHDLQGFSFGSKDSCIAAYTYRLYGTHLDFDEVVRFYQERLPLEGWAEAEGLSRPAWFSQTRHFLLTVSADAEGSGAPAETIEEGRRSYPTLYRLALTYMVDPSCWQI
jgi:hypothetical protein